MLSSQFPPPKTAARSPPTARKYFRPDAAYKFSYLIIKLSGNAAPTPGVHRFTYRAPIPRPQKIRGCVLHAAPTPSSSHINHFSWHNSLLFSKIYNAIAENKRPTQIFHFSALFRPAPVADVRITREPVRTRPRIPIDTGLRVARSPYPIITHQPLLMA